MYPRLFATLKTSTVLIGGALLAHQAMASGYHFGTQSVSSQSTANASAAEAADASTIFYNAAGMTKLDGTNISGTLNIIMPNVKYKNAKGYYSDGSEIKGDTSGRITKRALAVPHGYVTHQLNDQWFAGLGIYVPFASETEYTRESVLRYNVNKTALTSIDINPTIAFKMNEQHSFAAGLIAQYSTAEIRQFADFGGPVGGAIGLPGTSGMADGHAAIKGHDWGFGYNLAWMWDATDDFRVGANYRSKIKHTLKGDARWDIPGSMNIPGMGDVPIGGIISDGLGYKNTDARVKIETPESVSVHAMYKVNPQWNVFGDVTWTRHSRFNNVDINYVDGGRLVSDGNGGQTISDKTTLKPNWRNTYKVALGASYQVTEPLQLRFGVAYDQSPVRNNEERLSTMPDSDRMWFSMGGKYDINKNSSINVAYSYLKIKDSSANVNGWCGGPATGDTSACVSSRTNGSADYKSYAQIVGVQYNYKF
ncbi:MAG: transporter [Neisseriaceae bacterium]|nr:transporter [Neisseriaceae bacterium]